MRKKSIIFVLIISVIFLCGFNIYSCKDNPLNQIVESEGFDSARFNVRIDTILFIESMNMYAADTSNLFFYGYDKFAYYDGNTYHTKPFTGGFEGHAICGTNKNNVYIGGENYHTGRPQLRKWDGSGFIEISVIDSTDEKYPIQMLFAKSQKEIWMMAGDKSILRYDGFDFKRYDFDTLQNWSYFLTDENNTLCCVRFRDSSNMYYNAGKFSFKFYKYINENWEYYSYHEFYYPQEEILRPINIGNEIYATSSSGIYKFDGFNFTKIINVNSFKLYGLHSNQRTASLNNLLVTGSISFGYNLDILHWNGKKWSIENDKNIIFLYNFYCVGDKIIAHGSPDYVTFVYFFSKKS